MSALLENLKVEAVLRGLACAVGILFLLMGLGFLIMPELFATALLAAEPARAVGINSMRGDFGGLFLGMSGFTLVGALTRRHHLLLVPIVFLLLIIAGRVLSVAVDDVPFVVRAALVGEVLFLGVLGLSMRASGLRSAPDVTPHPLSGTVQKRIALAVAMLSLVVFAAFRAERQLGMLLFERGAKGLIAPRGVERLPDGLHVGLAGTGAPLPDARRRGGCSFVLAGEHLFIVDSGPGSTLTLELMNVPLGKVEAVLLTHLHSDHMGGLGELMLKAWTRGVRSQPLEVMGPPGVESVVAGLKQAYAVDTEARIAHHGDAVAPRAGAGGVARTLTSFDAQGAAVIFAAEDLTVTAFLVDHRPVEPAFGYRFDYKGRSLVISGDTLPSESLRRQAQGTDLLIHEVLQPKMLQVVHDAALVAGRENAAAVTKDILGYHTFPEEVARIARDANVRQVVFHHFLPAVPLRSLHSAFLGDTREIFDGPVTMGVEGMVFSLPPRSAVIETRFLL
ncbi:MAG: MBL fold metallo-hydrolase [Myxococcales bacterium]|nr:MBL fold metallo-hydrolase [Myxococcales bacterium]